MRRAFARKTCLLGFITLAAVLALVGDAMSPWLSHHLRSARSVHWGFGGAWRTS